MAIKKRDFFIYYSALIKNGWKNGGKNDNDKIALLDKDMTLA